MASIQLFDQNGSVYVCLCASGESLEGNSRGGKVILKSEDITSRQRDYDLSIALLSAGT